MNKVTTLAGRILLSLIFVLSGLTKIMGWSSTAGYMQSKGLPHVPVLLAGAILCEVGGGLLLMLGYRARLVAWLLFLYLIPTTLIFHNFWTLQGMERMDNMAHFLKNLAIMGGMLIVAGSGAGPLSLDARAAKTNS